MKYHNIVIAFMLCIGLSCSQMQASQAPGPEAPVAGTSAPGWGSYLTSGLSSGYQQLQSQLQSMLSYATGKAGAAMQAAHGTAKDIGYQKVAASILMLISVAGYFGITPIAVLAMVKDFVMQPDLLKRAGQAVVAAGTAVASTASAIYSSPYAGMAGKVLALKYLGKIDEQNRVEAQYKNLALEVVKQFASVVKQSAGLGIDNSLQNLIATELSNRLIVEKQGASNITLDDVALKFNDPKLKAEVLNACKLQEAAGSENSKVLISLIDRLSKKHPEIQMTAGAAQQLAQTTQTVGGVSAPITGQQKPQPPYIIMQNGARRRLDITPVYNSADGYWYGRLVFGQNVYDFFFNPTTGLWEQWVPRA